MILFKPCGNIKLSAAYVVLDNYLICRSAKGALFFFCEWKLITAPSSEYGKDGKLIIKIFYKGSLCFICILVFLLSFCPNIHIKPKIIVFYSSTIHWGSLNTNRANSVRAYCPILIYHLIYFTKWCIYD